MRKNLRTALLAAISVTMATAAVTTAQPSPAGASQVPFAVGGAVSPREQADLERWIADTHRILTSAAFKQNLKTIAPQYPHIWLGSGMRYGNASALEAVMTFTPDGYRFVPSAVAVVGHRDNNAAWAGHSGESDANSTPLTYINLGRTHLARFRSADAVERSCAINTLAHEMTHTISNSPQFVILVLEDEGSGGPGVGTTTPIASYLVGSVAQCTYLQQEGRIQAGDLKSCVATFGISSFASNRCGRFPGTGPVTWPNS